MDFEKENAASVGIIGGADGPTAVICSGKRVKMPLKVKLKNRIHRHRRMLTERKITAGGHSLEELTAYAEEKYGAAKVAANAASCCVWEIRVGEECLVIEPDPARDTFGVSFSGSRKAMRKFKKIAKDLYRYYGVSENDIAEKTERYYSLLGVLSM